MSRFRGSIRGSRGEATRQGTKQSGMVGHIRGWDIGCQIHLYVDENREDKVSLGITGGSNNPFCLRTIGTFTRKEIDDWIKGGK